MALRSKACRILNSIATIYGSFSQSMPSAAKSRYINTTFCKPAASTFDLVMASISGSMSIAKTFSTNYLRCGYGKSSIAQPNSRTLPMVASKPRFLKMASTSKKLCHIASGGIPLSRVFTTVSHSLNKLCNMTTAVPCHRPLHWEIPHTAVILF